MKVTQPFTLIPQVTQIHSKSQTSNRGRTAGFAKIAHTRGFKEGCGNPEFLLKE